MKKWFLAALSLLVLVTGVSFAFAGTDTDSCNNFINGGDYPRAIESGRKAVKTSAKDIGANYCLGRAYAASGQLNNALDAFKQAERFSSNKFDLMNIYRQLGMVLTDKGDNDSALNYHERSLGLARELGEKEVEASQLNNLGNIFSYNGQIDKAMDYYQQSLELTTSDNLKATIHNNIAMAYNQKGNYTAGIDNLQKAIEISLRIGDYHGAAQTILNLGSTYKNKGDYAEAEKTLFEGLERIRKVGDSYWEAVAYQYLGLLYKDMGDRPAARKNFQTAIDLFKKLGAQGNVDSSTLSLNTLNTPQTVAGIEIGAKGVKANVVVMTPTSDDDYNIDEKFRRSINTTIIAGVKERGEFDQSSIDETAKAVKEIYEQMTGKLQINANDIFVVGSSAMWKAKNKDKLAEKVKELTGKELSFITVEQEVLFNIAGAIPPKYRDKSLSLDIGSGNTKIGYMDPSGGWRAVTTEISLGTVTFTDAINKADQSGDKFGATADKILKEQLLGKLRAESQKKPGFKNRRPVYLVGGIAWAIATLTHPGDQEGFMKLTLNDIDGFIKRLEKNPDAIYTVNLDRVKKAEVKEWTTKQVNSVKDVFTTENLLAGAKLLKGVYGELKIKDAKFSRYGSWLWGFSAMQGMYRDQMAQEQVAAKK
jgi:tetratricopeptide (TPR) repeat protein